MPRTHDDWERLVAAVLKRDQIWQLCHAPSRSVSSISSSFSPGSSSRFEEDPIFTEQEWCDEYSPGVYITLASCPDGTEQVKHVQFSPRVFNESQQAEMWWLNNMKEVYEKYISSAMLIELDIVSGRVIKPVMESHIFNEKSISCEWFQPYAPGVFVNIAAFKDKSREVKLLRFSRRRFNNQEAETWWSINRERVLARCSRPPLSGIHLLSEREQPILILDFNEVLTSADGDGPSAPDHQNMYETIERYKQGVYVTLVSKEKWKLDIERVRFSKNIFKPHEAVDWWDKNQEQVYKKYGIIYRICPNQAALWT